MDRRLEEDLVDRVTINQQALRDLQRDLEAKFSMQVNVPVEGSEAEAVVEVQRQYKEAKGVDLPAETAREVVRQARTQA
ncbi:hypothetical protein [Nocardia asteroides]|uniref:hypothetical protein n=1 Tax=Nocardia asteroides TaxID=1824 RepID=UPI001E4EF7D7|nr:hypothetical protein [Nocardia asteroides]UGT64414.1 hypothetical protein LTT61_14485 [Nocardia asteroides]